MSKYTYEVNPGWRELRSLAEVERHVTRNTSLARARPRQDAFISTTYEALDNLLGGGIARGRVSEIFGAHSVGKTRMALGIVAAAQRSGTRVVFIDADCKLNWRDAKKLGVDVEELLVYRPDTAEQTAGLTDSLLSEPNIGLLVLDSLPSLIPDREFSGDVSNPDCNYAGFLGRWARKTAFLASRAEVAVLVVNQLRCKVGAMFGRPETTPGGSAFKNCFSVRIELKVKQVIRTQTLPIGFVTTAVIAKTHLGSYGQECEIPILFPEHVGADALKLAKSTLDIRVAATAC